jgi:SAM-dependent methyltransferase
MRALYSAKIRSPSGKWAMLSPFKLDNGLPRSSFAQMNIFNLAIKDNSFDVVISHGVLHHTFDARRAFAQIVRKAKPGGVVMVGLYNYYARVPTYLRSKVIGLTGGKIDYVVRNRIRDERKAPGLFAKSDPASAYQRVVTQLSWLGTIAREGALFDVIGRRKEAS